MDIEDDGTVVYQLLGRQKIAARPLPAPAATLPALVPMVRGHREASPMLAGLLTLFVPGAGHLYVGRFVAAVLWFLVVGAGYALILPGLILHLFSIASAASAAH